MARPKAATPKEPGRLKQLWQVFQMTRKTDHAMQWLVIGTVVLGILLGILLGLLLGQGAVFITIIWILLGLVAGLLGGLIVLSRRAERAAYARISGQPGAVGAVLRSSLRRGWRGSEVPIAVNGRTQDAVYRAVGRPGVVLIAEGPKTRTQRMVDEERRKVTRVAPNVPVSVLVVSNEPGSLQLHQINRSLGKFKAKLTRAEVLAVSNRLESLTGGLPVPKGIDPTRARSVRR
jgi:Domain of unknown function (DUF4191)